jgi:hypothetical protein
MPQSVTLLYWGERRRTELLALLGRERRLNVIGSGAELADGGQSVDVLVVDVPALIRRSVVEQVRAHYRGRLVVLLDPGDSSHDLPPDHDRTLLTRPFSAQELSATLAGSAPRQVPSDPADDPGTVLPRRAQAHTATSHLGRGRRLAAHVVPRLVRSWRERRLVRLSAILLLAALAFAVAFAMVNQDAGCGSACDELTGADLTSPSTTLTPVVAGPDRTASSTTKAGPTTTNTSLGSTADVSSRVDGGTGATPQTPRTTVGSSRAPATTRPQATASPTTTAPTTTRPTTSTSTTTSTTATTGP